MQATIQKMYTKEITTSKGEATRLDCYFDMDELFGEDAPKVRGNKKIYTKQNTVLISAFQGKWNAEWEEGKTVEFELEKNASKDNNKLFLNAKCPEHLKGGGGSVDLTPVMNELSAVKDMLNTVIGILETMESPNNTNQVNEDDDIPF